MFAASAVNRRSFLLASLSTSTVALGCRPATEPTTAPPSTTRRDVPLRVVLAGPKRASEVIKTAWSAVSEQPLEINVLDPTNVPLSNWDNAIVQAMQKADLGIVPSGVTASLAQARLIANWRSESSSPVEEENPSDELFPVLLENVAQFGGQRIGQPLGASVPALMFAASDEGNRIQTPQTWLDYESLVEQLTAKGTRAVCAEPLAGGAAANMFLWRTSNYQPPVWLFDRENLKPAIDSEVYVKSLESLARCAKLYGSKRLSAGEVWQQVAAGKLQLALGWPAVHSDNELIADAEQSRFAPLPFGETPQQLPASPAQGLVSAEALVAIVSSKCRQSEAARRLAMWLSGTEGTSMIRDSIDGYSILAAGDSSRTKPPAGTLADSYEQVLSIELSKVVIRPSLRIVRYRDYLQTLDQAVLDCLDGKLTAAKALEQTAESWAKLHAEVGIDKQSKAWRMAQGLSG